MAGLYVDTSALGRVLLAEPDAAVIRATLANYEEQWSSDRVTVELGRLGKLHALRADAHQLLSNIRLVRITSPRLRTAAAIDPPEVRTLDAIHLSAAAALHSAGTVAAVLTFDSQLQAGCQHHGIAVEAPVT
ncbi:MAG: PIN domain-containing protein [Solirubrobacteraceae bacterium]